MARFNPPHLAHTPEGWEPEGWHPDPSWPPAPEGWELWVDDESDDPSTTTSQLQSDSTAPLPARTGRRPIWQRTGVIVSALVGVFPSGRRRDLRSNSSNSSDIPGDKSNRERNAHAEPHPYTDANPNPNTEQVANPHADAVAVATSRTSCHTGTRTTRASASTTAGESGTSTGTTTTCYLLQELRRGARCRSSPLHRGQPGYSSNLDKDGDGVACE